MTEAGEELQGQVDRGYTRRDCPVQGCFWNVEVLGEDQGAREEADYAAEKHYHDEHCEDAKVRVVLERETNIDYDESLRDVVDRFHDKLDEEPPPGWEVAFAFGENLDRETAQEDSA